MLRLFSRMASWLASPEEVDGLGAPFLLGIWPGCKVTARGSATYRREDFGATL